MLDPEYRDACLKEQNRLEIAEKWARINRSDYARNFDRGRQDRILGQPCRSSNGAYLDGWYSLEYRGSQQ